MAFLRKHLVWVLLGLVLVGEGVFTAMLVGRKSAIATKLDDLKSKQKEAARLERERPGEPDVIAAYERRQGTVREELTDALLFLWHRGQALERLFPDPDLAKFKPRPWGIVGGLDRFRLQYQNSYNKEVEKLLPKIKGLLVTRESVGLADVNYFTQSEITVGDIFAAQKKFWLVAKIVEIAHKTGMANLPRLRILRAAEVDARGRLRVVRRGDMPAANAAQLFNPITLDIAVRCKSLKLDQFLEKLHDSPLLCARIKSVTNIERSRSLEAVVRAVGSPVRRVPGGPAFAPRRPPGGLTPEMEMEGMTAPPDAGGPPGEDLAPPPLPEMTPPPGAEATPTVTERRARRGLLVTAQFMCEIPDFNVGLYQVAFSASAFKGKTPVKSQVAKWVAAQIRKADAVLKDAKATKEKPDWISNGEQTFIDARGKALREEGEEATGKQAEPVALLAYPDTPYQREYAFRKPQLALDWLVNPQAYVALRAAALRALWQRILDTLPTDRAKVGSQVVITFRPEKHFSPKDSHKFDQTLSVDAPAAATAGKRGDATISVTVKLRLATYQAEESSTGLKYMAGSLRY